ncbi:E3 ubiquitin-protein ligase RNF34-like [Styela clava]|uniref:E3 ubiquitin-protein ligase rififylin-like n=1 Tax=Styela clava TaxID=7725 RepID=UPI0019394642|nr:E3 ubiquitin-protein ligase rififylin-like [Styela clava]
MPCTYCNVSFSIIKWKNKCQTCMCMFCTNCIIEKRCVACHNVLDSRLQFEGLMKVRVKDLKIYSSVRGLPVNTCKEKNELVYMILQNCNAPNPPQMPRKPSNSTPNYPRMAQNPQPNEQRNRHDNNPPYPPNGSYRMPQPEQFQANSFPQPPEYNRTQRAFPTADEILSQLSGSSHFNISAGSDIPGTNVDPPETPVNVESETDSKPPISSTPPPKPTPTGNGNKLLIVDITIEAQIDYLSIREMKQILADNFVDYKGCVEKSELKIRVKNLYQDRSKNEEIVSQEEAGTAEMSDNTCKICWDQPIDCVLLECGHMATCTSCGKKMNECPICRQYVVRCVHVFRT